jgi:hypothetical protein
MTGLNLVPNLVGVNGEGERQQELAQLRGILSRQRWFFVQVAGRRRIGKTFVLCIDKDRGAATIGVTF